MKTKQLPRFMWVEYGFLVFGMLFAFQWWNCDFGGNYRGVHLGIAGVSWLPHDYLMIGFWPSIVHFEGARQYRFIKTWQLTPRRQKVLGQ